MAYIREYVGYSCICRHTAFLGLTIKSNNYLILILVSLGFALTTLPHYADAFWPFSTNAGATVSSVMPSSSTSALVATINSDPNAGRDVPLTTSGNTALISYSGPAGTIADVLEAPKSDRISVYVVRSGDTISDIATMFDVSINTIIWANDLSGPKDIRIGERLVILPISGVKRTIVKGDTLKSIAKKYGSEATEIAIFNGLDPEVALGAGSVVIIPGGEVEQEAPKVAVKKKTKSTTPYTGSSSSGASTSGYFTNPVPGSHVTQGIHGKNGVDLGKARGASILAAANGTVLIARNSGWNGGYGNYVVISHPNGTQTLYAHLASASVSAGQSVSQGQTIGYMGNTGKSTGVHLHFEVRGASNPFAR